MNVPPHYHGCLTNKRQYFMKFFSENIQTRGHKVLAKRMKMFANNTEKPAKVKNGARLMECVTRMVGKIVTSRHLEGWTCGVVSFGTASISVSKSSISISSPGVTLRMSCLYQELRLIKQILRKMQPRRACIVNPTGGPIKECTSL